MVYYDVCEQVGPKNQKYTVVKTTPCYFSLSVDGVRFLCVSLNWKMEKRYL